jgi:surfactin synthase thioesterase subunit
VALLASGSPAPSRRNQDCLAGKDDVEALIEDLCRQGGTPKEVFANKEMLRVTLDVLGSDYRVVETYEHKASVPLPMSLHVFAGRDDEIDSERINAWQEEAGGRFSVEWFDGGHFFVRHSEMAVLKAIIKRLSWEWRGGGQNATHPFT